MRYYLLASVLRVAITAVVVLAVAAGVAVLWHRRRRARLQRGGRRQRDGRG